MKNDVFNKEYIACAAIWYEDNEQHVHQEIYCVPSGIVVGCFRHHLCPFPMNVQYDDPDMKVNHALKTKNVEVHQGFITSYGRYVNRYEAYKIALSVGQIDDSPKYHGQKKLYSEDIFTTQAYKYDKH